jgi:hypothetical protein
LEIAVRRYFIAVLFIIVLLTGLLVPTGPATAQEENWEIRINQFSLFEGPDTALLKLYFNIYDERSGAPMLNIAAENAEITLLNTAYTTQGELKKPDIPIYVTLVLDSSGSMTGAASKLQEAAKLALNNTPENSRFSIVQFDQEIKLLQDFTENLSALAFAVDQYKALDQRHLPVRCRLHRRRSALQSAGWPPGSDPVYRRQRRDPRWQAVQQAHLSGNGDTGCQ